VGTGKPEDNGQGVLFGESTNLGEDQWNDLREWLTLVGKKNGFVFHNAKFDLHLMEAGIRRWPGQGIDLSAWTIWDTQNVCHLMWPESKTTSLKPTSARLWGAAETDESAKVKNHLTKGKLPSGRWDLVPWELIGPYADQDARLTIRLYYHQLWALTAGEADWFREDRGQMNVHQAIERRLRTTLMLFRIERRGLPFDAEQAAAQAVVIQKRFHALADSLPFKPITLPMAKHYWFGRGSKNGVVGLGLPAYATTDKGEPQVNAFIVEKMAKDGVPAAAQWRDLQKLQTADSRWYTGWASMVGPDGRLRASVRQNGTVSSRFSVERVQLQAIPHDYRLAGGALSDILTPRALIGRGVPRGFQLWELDLAQAELRVAALFANCTRMLKLINEDQDLHGDAATQLFGVTPDDPKWGQMRNVAKRANFSLIFGVGAEKLQADIETQTGMVLTLEEARVLVRDWNALYPEFQQAIRQHMDVVEKRMRSNPHGLGWLQTRNGERRWFQPDEDTHKAFNQRVQPNLAQFGIDWWLDVEATVTAELGDFVVEDAGSLEPLGRVGVVMLIHDSIVMLLPEGEVGERIAFAARDRGRELWSEFFPGVPGDVDVKKWGEK
jgi:DNA polymerase I-like protein with 3'-5' exonuclease and polymerase domains